jgi:hypothetical protein
MAAMVVEMSYLVEVEMARRYRFWILWKMGEEEWLWQL